MPTKVILNIDGFCMCFRGPSGMQNQRNRAWNIQFVCDANHTVTTTGPDGKPLSLWTAGEDSQVYFRSDIDDLPPATYSPLHDKNRILNLADPMIHGDGGSSRRELRLERRRRFPVDQVWLRVPGARLSVDVGTDGRSYWRLPLMVQPGSVDEPMVCIGPKATSINVEFEIDRLLEVEVVSDNGTPQTTSYPASSGGAMVFTLRNRCVNPHPGATNDFRYLYDFVIDDDGSGERQFDLGKSEDCGTPPTPAALESIRKAVRSPQANCDPVIVEPPLGP